MRETLLEMARRHVAEQEERIAYHMVLIDRVVQKGHDTRLLLETFKDMEEVLDIMYAEIKRFEVAKPSAK